ncbi:MAG: glycoside hydrolase family 3 N-terminal domain-containing protein [Actinomycetes bacterium]
MRCRAAAAVVAGAAVLGACTAPPPPATPRSTTAPPTLPTPTTTGPPAPRDLGWGPTDADLEAARDAVAAMSDAELAGQVVVARYDGTSPDAAAALVAEHHLAGVVVMGDNVAGPDQLRATADAVQQAVRDGGRDWPAVVSVDQEGGRVARVDEPATAFPTLMTHGAARDPAVTEAAARASAQELRALGFTVVFAPVADVTTGPDDPTIGSRSASDDPAVVAEVVTAALQGYQAGGIVGAAKHYPGHGSVPADSHETLPVQDADPASLAQRDLVPFAAAARAGASMVMMSHIAVEAWDPGVPASLSPAAYGALRRTTGFDGVAVTDALDMAAVTRAHGPDDAAVRALAAGADLLLMPADTGAAVAALTAALADGTLARARVQESAARVVALMRHQAGAPVPDPTAVGAHAEASYAASLAGLTVVDGPCDGRLVGDAVQVVGGTAADRERFAAAAREAGLGVGSGDVVRLLGGPTSGGSGDVVVALDAPYGLAGSAASTARLALYGRTPQAFRALVDVLVGAQQARGRLPVTVEGLTPPCR